MLQLKPVLNEPSSQLFIRLRHQLPIDIDVLVAAAGEGFRRCEVREPRTEVTELRLLARIGKVFRILHRGQVRQMPNVK